jgi:hypothetical protein
MSSKKRARKNPKYIDWRTSEAKNTIMRDLADGWLTADETKLSAEKAWEVYQSADLPAFQGVCFQQFKERLADHRKAFLKQSEESIRLPHNMLKSIVCVIRDSHKLDSCRILLREERIHAKFEGSAFGAFQSHH